MSLEPLPKLADLLQIAITAATAGAEELTAQSGEPFETHTKGEIGNLVTDVDVAAEHRVRNAIATRRPDDLVSGEELPDSPGARATVRWSIDPLDGTTNYIRGLPFYCTSVAACSTSTGKWLVGAVVAPALGVTYFASLGGGAWMSRGGRDAVRISGPPPGRASRLLGTGFSYSRTVRENQYAQLPELMTTFSDLRRFGSAALEICCVAEGTLDAFHESDLYEYDWAAAALIAEEAGLSIVRPSVQGAAMSATRRTVPPNNG
ncbi:inositol monophosphatase family protein [Lacisediminihabitans profunda]|uniref:Inositol monophosphatase n=1 Tax=Lacisediminihabitans profunda TaxID=2594790 RepID=A0A5C8USK3_9MICO|nr:inositol monophosphatase family protein [Lacisediminihabitans profunda]TXN31237.1 inositol monophosphatase [Lacisediminihabitans profunda]